MRKDIYKDNIGYVTDEVSSINVSEANFSEENRIKWVTDLAAISRGKYEANNPEKRYQSLLKEAAPNDINVKDRMHASRPLEFLPIAVQVNLTNNSADFTDRSGEPIWEMEINHFLNNVMPFSYMEDNILYTNMRALYNAEMPYELIPYNDPSEIKHFKAFKSKLPMFVFNHIITHKTLSTELQSDRVVKRNNEYWLPSDFRDKVYTYIQPMLDENGDGVMAKIDSLLYYNFAHSILGFKDMESVINFMLNGDTVGNYQLSQDALQGFFKEIGYDKEIYQRALLEFRYKEMIFTGWSNNPKIFDHMILERNGSKEYYKNWTQKETELLILGIKELI